VNAANRPETAPTEPLRRIVVGLGANLGDAARTLVAAMDALQDFTTAPLLRSSLWHSAPEACPPGSPEFVNAVVGVGGTAADTPELWLRRLQELESRFGRRRTGILNEPRVLDLDLIACGEARMETARLVVPHPRAHLRAFVMAPLAEILPTFQAPGWPAPAAELWRALASAPGRPVPRRLSVTVPVRPA